ncbi:hypothetical protein V8C40DRAFT_246496 [Trichoderma camerunense]
MRAACATFGVSLFRSRCFLFFGPVFSSLLVSTVFFTARGWANEAASEVLVRASLLGPGLACRLLHSYQCKQSSRHKAPRHRHRYCYSHWCWYWYLLRYWSCGKRGAASESTDIKCGWCRPSHIKRVL